MHCRSLVDLTLTVSESGRLRLLRVLIRLQVVQNLTQLLDLALHEIHLMLVLGLLQGKLLFIMIDDFLSQVLISHLLLFMQVVVNLSFMSTIVVKDVLLSTQRVSVFHIIVFLVLLSVLIHLFFVANVWNLTFFRPILLFLIRILIHLIMDLGAN